MKRATPIALPGIRLWTIRAAAPMASAPASGKYVYGAVAVIAIAVCSFLLLIGRDRSVAAVSAPYPHELAQVTFAAAGDVIPHDAVRAAAAASASGDPTSTQGWGALLSDVSDVFKLGRFRIRQHGNARRPEPFQGLQAVHV